MSAVLQSSVDLAMAAGKKGVLAESFAPYKAITRASAGEMEAGRAAFRAHGALAGQSGSPVGEPGRAYQNPSPGIAADVDAILATGGATTASEQVFAVADADGIVGGEDMLPGRKITLVLSNHTDWNATTAVIRYVDQLTGLEVEEDLSIPNGGNDTITTVGYARRFVSLTLPAQESTGGSFTIGVSALDAGLTAADFLGVVIRKPGWVMADEDAAMDYADGDAVPLLRKGPIYVETETACVEGDPVYFRVAGSGDLGAFRHDADGGSNAVLLPNARWGKNSGAGELNILELE